MLSIMNLAKVLLLLFLLNTHVYAQSSDPVRQTWSGPDVSALLGLLKDDAAPSATRTESLKFTPAGDSGVTKTLADALGNTAQERATMAQVFEQIKQAYETEVAKEGKSNNLAAAMTFFISANVVAYHQIALPSDADSAMLFESLQRAMIKLPAFAQMSNSEKQRLHDWLVCMGGFTLTNYENASQSADKGLLATMKDFADYSLRLALGIEAKKLSLRGSRLNVESATAPVNNKIIGAWTTASAQGVGHMRLRYIFSADGTYSFKSERNYTSQRWWTIEETGVFSIDGNSLTISPKVSQATLRNLDGVVQERRSQPLEKVTYNWTTHYFEGIGETNLVLQPPQPTSRDGIMGGNSLFPKAYLYTQGDRLEWRFKD